MKTILTIGGIGLIAYALYEWLASQAAPASAASGTPATGTTFTQPAGNPPPAATPTPTPPATAAITTAVLNAAAKGDPAVNANGMATWYVWNYYWQNLSGTTSSYTPPNPMDLISAATFLTLRASAGLSGFRANNFNPYTMRYPLIRHERGGLTVKGGPVRVQ